MRKVWKGLYFSVVLWMTVPVLTGCVAFAVGAAAGAGGYAYVKGNLERNYDHTVSELYKAALKAFKNLNIEKTEAEREEHAAYLYGLNDEGKKVKVIIEALTERSSKLEVRVGILGDKLRSQEIITVIENKL